MSAPTEREDFLDEDVEIPGQKFVLLSFLSPEKVLANKDSFLFSRFVKDYEVQYKTKKLESFLVGQVKGINDKLEAEAVKFEKVDLSGAALICRSNMLKIEDLVADMDKYVRSSTKEIQDTRINEDYDDYLYKNRSALEEEFFAKNNFRTTVRGLKVRGVYASQPEAVARSKKLQRNDQVHNIFVGEVGKWLPWEPDPNSVADQEYAEDQLNMLMKKYKENEDARETFVANQRKEARGVKTMTGTKVGEESDTASLFSPSGPAATGATGAAKSSYDGMFSGPADLALERKMKKKEEE
jgi:hypothetical protein